MRFAFVFFAEAYQIYHGAAAAFALMKREGVSVDFFHNMPASEHHFQRLAAAHGLPHLKSTLLSRSRWTAFVQSLHIFGWEKTPILRQNEAMLRAYDAVVVMEDGASILFSGEEEGQRPARILIMHGAGDRDVPSFQRRRAFDLMLTLGPKLAEKLLALGHAREGHVAAPGYIKFDSSRLFRDGARQLFPEDRPIILYNPHKNPKLSSWRRFIQPLLSGVAEQRDFNLIVAPHVKMFARSFAWQKRRWQRLSRDNILIDTGSDRSVDNSYTEAADIYVGDISSQVYEFLSRPRPCVFLNAHGVKWQDDINFLFWQLGDVVDDPKNLMAAIRAAPARHHLYIEKQKQFAARSLGDTSLGAAERAADTIMHYMRHGKVSL